MKEEVEVTGQSVEKAIAKGLKELKIEQDDAVIKILDEGKSGLFGLMGATPARIKISVKSCAEEPGSAEPVGSEEVDINSACKKATAVFSDILKLLGFSAHLSTESCDGGFIINADQSEDSAILIGRNGRTMLALEYILKLVLRKQGIHNVRILLNVDGYLARKTERLSNKAKELADTVRRTGEPIKLRLPASERRIMHLALKESPDIETVSEGPGPERFFTVRQK